ncbi:aminopeptidase [Fusibacter sp. JL216-2]|uniref:aminopeptidase n=1 Tax=Fusibacter sp. JL216-2 TaxID=3071453 RepID=UPI003D35046B
MEEKKSLLHTFRNVWENADEAQTKEIFSLNDEYKKFLDRGKTERECARDIVKMAQENGYVSVESVIEAGQKIEPGMKIYALNRDKSIILFVVGKEPIEKGMRIVGGHIDSPRLDLKPFPLYEDSGIAMFKTHYYGGVRKYQWASIPLAMHGVVMNKNGEKINICIGEDADDPVLFITDLLPHLAKDQNQKKLGEAITGEGLNLLVGTIPASDEEKDKVKTNVMRLLNEKYGIEEIDFTSAELEIVPAGKARDVGFDRSMISAYGHDDRVCSFAGVKAILETENPTYTAVGMFMDKEEVGSMGNTGSESRYFENMVAELIALQADQYSDLLVRRSLSATKVLSADVCAAFDPNYPEVSDKRNTSFIGNGVQITKYTGARGKAGCNDANAEFVSEARNLFDANDIVWQIGELGKVDQGGGGTIAYILANAGAEVVDCGTPMLSMHAPYEIVSKADVYMTYKAYKAFMNR